MLLYPGGVQHLKSKFAKGFSLVLRLKPDTHSDDPAAHALKKDIAQRLQPCELKDEHQVTAATNLVACAPSLIF